MDALLNVVVDVITYVVENGNIDVVLNIVR